MFKKVNYNVLSLNRKAFAFLTVDELEIGGHRELTLEEEEKLRQIVG